MPYFALKASSLLASFSCLLASWGTLTGHRGEIVGRFIQHPLWQEAYTGANTGTHGVHAGAVEGLLSGEMLFETELSGNALSLYEDYKHVSFRMDHPLAMDTFLLSRRIE